VCVMEVRVCSDGGALCALIDVCVCVCVCSDGVIVCLIEVHVYFQWCVCEQCVLY
jgi:hypothetical protein